MIAPEDMQDTENEINKKWQMAGFWILLGEFINC